MTGTIRDTDGGIVSEQAARDGRGVVSRAGRSMLRMGVRICVLVLAGSLFAGVAVADGPSEVSNWTDLQGIDDDLDGDYVLVADLDKNTEGYDDVVGDGNFRPIGPTFTGSLDGNGQTISDLVISGGSDVGLFSTSEGDIHRLALKDVEIHGDDGRVGGIVGTMEGGKISESYVTGEVSGSAEVGGLMGRGTAGEVNAAYTVVDVSVGVWRAGGLVGYVPSGTLYINESYAAGTLTGDRVGGVVGEVLSGTLNLESVYWDRERSGTTSTAGRVGSGTVSTNNVTGLSSDQMKGDAAEMNMDGFDFADTWTAEAGDFIFYPYLQSTPQNPASGRENSRFAGGLGTADNPLQIDTWEHLHRVSEVLDAHFELIGDLDQETDGYNEYVTDPSEGFEPIGDEADPFTGVFDGSGNVINGLYIDQNGDHVGLFGSVGSTGRLTRVGLDAVNVTGNEYVGGVAGESAGEIDQSWVSGNVTGSVTVGGLVGHTAGPVSESYAVGTVMGDSTVGGLVGHTEEMVTESYAEVTVTGESTVGGLVGHTEGAVAESYAVGTVTGNSTVGGLVGAIGSPGDVSESYAASDVEADTEYGGLVGANDGEVSSSFWNVDVVESGDGVGSDDGTFGATGLSTNDMRGEAALANMSDDFNFDETWTVETGQIISYPYLQAIPQDPVPGYDNQGFAGGIGSAEDPFQIETWDHLHNVRGELDAHFELVGNLDNETEGFSEFVTDPSTGFEPIGDNENPFTGTLNGDGFVIENLVINRSTSDDGKDAALFLAVDGGTIEDIGLVDAEITAGDGEDGESGTSPTSGGDGGNAAGFALTNSNGNMTNTYVTDSEITAGAGGAGGSASGGSETDGASGGAGGHSAGLVLEGTEVAVSDSFVSETNVSAGDGGDGGSGSDGIDEDDQRDGGDGGLGGGGGDAGGLLYENDGGTIVDSWISESTISGGDGAQGGNGGDGDGSGGDGSGRGGTGGTGGDGGTAAGLVSSINEGEVVESYSADTKIHAGAGGSGGDAGDSGRASGSHGVTGGEGGTAAGLVSSINEGEVVASYSADTEINAGDGGSGGDGGRPSPGRTGGDGGDGGGSGTAAGLVSSINEGEVVESYSADTKVNAGDGGSGGDRGGLSDTSDGNDGSRNSAAGLIGVATDTTITNVSVDATITGGSYTGGLVGENVGGTISNSTATGSVESSGNWVGGLVGENDGGTVQGSYATGSVIGSGSNVGGLVGMNAGGGDVTKSYATGSATSTDTNRVGGLVGWNRAGSTITDSYATGSATGSEDVGGLVGQNVGTIESSYATGSVDGTEDVGGLVGFNRDGGTINASYAIGSVEDADNVGGLVGVEDGTTTDSYWNIETINQSESASGIGLTIVEMTGDRAAGNMFEFGETWQAGQDDNPEDGLIVFYPVLQNATQDPEPNSTLFAGGNGTEAAPYQITDWFQLDYVRLASDSDVVPENAHFKLTADLDEETSGYEQIAGPEANGGDGFDPIGDTNNQFEGTFDGSEHTISDLTISRSGVPYVALFGFVGEDGTLTNVSLDAVHVEGGNFAGGLVGLNGGNITASYANGSVDGDDRVGGLVGSNDGGTITDVYANGSVDGNEEVGGLVGENDGAITNSYSDGTVNGSGVSVGGLAGVNSDEITASYANALVNGSSDVVGGLVGVNAGDSHITDSYATGSVDGDDGVGGLAGVNAGHITDSYATGSVEAVDNDVGGLVGQNTPEGEITTSYWDIQTTGQNESAGDGTGLTTIEMTGDRAADSMAGFDFDETWEN